MQSVKEKQQNIFSLLKDKLGLVNPMQAPRLEKIVVNVGTGSVSDKNKVELIQDRLARITGQKPAPRSAKKSIASFKIRQGDVIGFQVTLRGGRMFSFLDKLIHVALPRTKDFRGLSRHSVDEMGNYTLGIKEHTVFPETSDEELSNVFGMSITFVTSASSKEKAVAYLEEIGLPFKKEEDDVKKRKKR